MILTINKVKLSIVKKYPILYLNVIKNKIYKYPVILWCYDNINYDDL